METTLTGHLISVETRSYSEFTGQDGSTVPAGQTFYAWIDAGPEAAPKAVKLPNEGLAALLKKLTGSKVSFVTSMYAQNNRISLRYVSHTA